MRRQYGVIIVRHGKQREPGTKSGRKSKPNAYRRYAKQRPGNFRHTEAHRMADLRALLCRSAVGGLFPDAGDYLAVAERIV